MYEACVCVSATFTCHPGSVVKTTLEHSQEGFVQGYLVFDNLLADLGRLGSHGLCGAYAPLGGTQPFAKRLQSLVEVERQHLQLF